MRTLTLNEHLGVQVKTMRELRGLTQQELAEKSGLSRVSIYQIELGNASASISTLGKISNVLECDLSLDLYPKENSYEQNENDNHLSNLNHKQTMELKNMSSDELQDFIRKTLAFDTRTDYKIHHHRFEMSGYESSPGECTIHNLEILNKFAFLGIYDYTHYLFLDFNKGHGTLYYQYYADDTNRTEELGGFGTTEIIETILNLTVLSGKRTRRRG